MKQLYLALVTVLFWCVQAHADDAKPWTVDMTAPLYESDNKPIKDCPPTWDAKVDPERKECPDLTLASALSYAVSFTLPDLDQKPGADWRPRAVLRALLEQQSHNHALVLTRSQADSAMERIGQLYNRYIPREGEKVVIAAMKALQPAEYSKLLGAQ